MIDQTEIEFLANSYPYFYPCISLSSPLTHSLTHFLSFRVQDTAFTRDERMKYSLAGILPSAVRKLDEQIENAMKAIRSFNESMGKYMYLRNLQDWNERLFFSLLTRHTEELMPIVYTPIVGEACQKFRYNVTSISECLIKIFSLPHTHTVYCTCGHVDFSSVERMRET